MPGAEGPGRAPLPQSKSVTCAGPRSPLVAGLLGLAVGDRQKGQRTEGLRRGRGAGGSCSFPARRPREHLSAAGGPVLPGAGHSRWPLPHEGSSLWEPRKGACPPPLCDVSRVTDAVGAGRRGGRRVSSRPALLDPARSLSPSCPREAPGGGTGSRALRCRVRGRTTVGGQTASSCQSGDLPRGRAAAAAVPDSVLITPVPLRFQG